MLLEIRMCSMSQKSQDTHHFPPYGTKVRKSQDTHHFSPLATRNYRLAATRAA